MIFIDANVFIAYYNTDDVHHKKAKLLFKKIENGVYGSAFTSDYVLNEVVGITYRKRGIKKAIETGQMMFDSVEIFFVDEDFFMESWNLFSKTNLKLNLVDCTNTVITKNQNIATFDKEFFKVKGLKVIS